jgi:hypothetical protein
MARKGRFCRKLAVQAAGKGRDILDRQGKRIARHVILTGAWISSRVTDLAIRHPEGD